MALQVCLVLILSLLIDMIITGARPLDNDYVAVSREIVQFNVGDTFQTHTIFANNDMHCEGMPNEEFFSNIALGSGVQPINVINPNATVTIDDSGEAECSELCCVQMYRC